MDGDFAFIGVVMKNIFVSCEMPSTTETILNKYGNVIELPGHPNLPDAISSHPDAIITKIGSKFFALKDYMYIRDYMRDVTFTSEMPTKIYPYDALVNCFVIDDILFSGKNISSCIKKYASDQYMVHIVVNQGYTKCSTLVYKNNIITSDTGIYSKAKDNNINALLISPGHIRIKDYEYGFIGGACGVIDDNVVFFGKLKNHPDYYSIKEFLSDCGANIIEDDTYDLTDFGGIVVN